MNELFDVIRAFWFEYKKPIIIGFSIGFILPMTTEINNTGHQSVPRWKDTKMEAFGTIIEIPTKGLTEVEICKELAKYDIPYKDCLDARDGNR